MRIVGTDLSGPRNFADTCLVSFEERGAEIHLIDVRESADDDQILEAISGLGQSERIVIGIDAPLSYNPKGGDRPSDSELRRIVHAQSGHVGIMPMLPVPDRQSRYLPPANKNQISGQQVQ